MWRRVVIQGDGSRGPPRVRAGRRAEMGTVASTKAARKFDLGAGGDLPIGELLRVLRAFKKGDFSARMSLAYVGPAGEVAEAMNDVLELSERMTQELRRINTVVGKEGKLGER